MISDEQLRDAIAYPCEQLEADIAAELLAARADVRRLSYIIESSNAGDNWLDEDVWDNLPGDSDDMQAEVRASIDLRMKQEADNAKP